MSRAASLRAASEKSRQRRQVVDVRAAPPPTVTGYQRIPKVCPCCGTVTTAGWDDPAVPVDHRGIVAASGSPVRIGPEALARTALLTCGHAGSVRPAFTGVLVRDGYAGYGHLTGALHAWCEGRIYCGTCGRSLMLIPTA